MLDQGIVHVIYLGGVWGVFIFGLIEFMKNNSFSAGWFVNADGSPSKLAQILALVGSIFPGLLTCIGHQAGAGEPVDPVMLPAFIVCILGILSSLAGSMGLHSAIKMFAGRLTKVQALEVEKKLGKKAVERY